MIAPIAIDLSPQHIIIRSRRSGRVLHKEAAIQPSIRPVVKWAGGKQWLAVAAPQLLPPRWTGGYYEPFFGGGAFFFAIEPARATLSDRNLTLMTTYRAIRNDTEGVIDILGSYPHNEKFYYRLRERSPRSPRNVAARLLYLNRTCWNGLYRVNLKGQFNTPFGQFTNPTICDRERLRQAAKLLRRARLRVADFETVAVQAQSGDFVYFDPPYISGHQHNGFLKYNARLFSWEDQERLARLVKRLSDAGVHVLVSNADQAAVVGLYKGFNCYGITRRSLIGGDVATRGETTEALLSSYPLFGVRSEAS